MFYVFFSYGFGYVLQPKAEVCQGRKFGYGQRGRLRLQSNTVHQKLCHPNANANVPERCAPFSPSSPPFPFFEITQLIYYIKSTFNDFNRHQIFCSHKYEQLYLSDYLQTRDVFLKICTYIFVSWSIVI